MSGVRPEFDVIFDGVETPTRLKVKPVGLMAVERRFGGAAFDDHPIEAMLFGAWVSIGKPGGDDGFDAWAATIADIDIDPTAGSGDVPDPSSATPTEPSPPSP